MLTQMNISNISITTINAFLDKKYIDNNPVEY
jgi:hypothetical protein